jgi:hypothetical protein
MRRIFCAVLAITSALAGLVSLPYLFMAGHELVDAAHGQLPADEARWEPFAAVGLTGTLSFGAFFMAARFLRHAIHSKPKPTN